MKGAYMTGNSPRLRRRAILATFAGAAASTLLAACGTTTAATVTSASTTFVRTPSGTTPIAAASATVLTTSTAPLAATTATPVATAPIAQTTGKKVVIEYWSNDNGTRAELVKRLAAQLNDRNAGLTVTTKTFTDYATLLQALQAAIAARVQPAVAQIGYGYLRYVATQVPHTTIEEVAKRDPQGAEFLSTKNFAPAVLDLGRVDGALRGMSYAMSVPLLWYNADLLKQASIERPPTIWSEVRAYGRQIGTLPGKNGLYIAESTNFWANQAFVESNGAHIVSGTGNDVRCTMDSPEAIQAMQYHADMVREKSAMTLPQAQADQSFTSGNLGMYLGSSTVYQNVMMAAKFTAGSVVVPTWDTKPRRVPIGGNALFIFGRDAEQQAAGWEWIKYLQTPENMTTWVKETGYLPTRLGLADNPQYLKSFYDQNPLLAPTLIELPDATQWYSFPGQHGIEAEKELLDARGRILTGQDAASVLHDAVPRINSLVRG